MGVLLLPALLILATPIVLVAALFGSDSYVVRVKRGYGRVVEIWAHLVLW